jgi:hypothetical protein
MSLANECINHNLEEYIDVMTDLESKLPDLGRERLEQIIHLVAVASCDLPQKIAEFLLTLATVCPHLVMTEK